MSFIFNAASLYWLYLYVYSALQSSQFGCKINKQDFICHCMYHEAMVYLLIYCKEQICLHP